MGLINNLTLGFIVSRPSVQKQREEAFATRRGDESSH
jgi:hypothetical protein